ncbi:hypothetical protein D3C81_1749210 [compost metagenome]
MGDQRQQPRAGGQHRRHGALRRDAPVALAVLRQPVRGPQGHPGADLRLADHERGRGGDHLRHLLRAGRAAGVAEGAVQGPLHGDHLHRRQHGHRPQQLHPALRRGYQVRAGPEQGGEPATGRRVDRAAVRGPGHRRGHLGQQAAHRQPDAVRERRRHLSRPQVVRAVLPADQRGGRGVDSPLRA